MKSLLSYTEQSKSVILYNNWFIKLRWYAAAALILFIVLLRFVFGFGFTAIQYYSYITTVLFILAYNIFFYRTIDKPGHVSFVSPKKSALFQILLDLLSLSVLVYFSGGVEAPIFLFFIFHMIIGSMILSEKLMYFIASVLISFLILFSAFEYNNLIEHMAITGLYPIELYKSLNYVAGFLSLFTFVLLMSIRLTSKIVRELYSREAQLRRALHEVDEAEKSKQKYLMAIVHELKTPIAAASSNLDLVLGNYVGEIGKQALDKLSRSKERLNESISSINNILRFSQFRLLNKIEPQELPLVELLDSVVKKIKTIADRKSIKIDFIITESLFVVGDVVLLELAFSNLLSNSVKYTAENGNIRVEVQSDATNVKINIADDGIGIPAEDLPKIFEEYYRASNAKSVEGTGTGLSTVKQIIESHKGNIKIKSPSSIGTIKRPGTEFQIILPLK